MAVNIVSTNPVVRTLIEGAAPRPAQVAASRALLPLPETDLLEVLVAYATSNDVELSENAREALTQQDEGMLDAALRSDTISVAILSYFAERQGLAVKAQEAVIQNARTPDVSILHFAKLTRNGSLLELVAFNQQLLVRVPAIIEAILANPSKTAEAERRASETKKEFFEKERGSEQIAAELRAQGKEAAAQFIEQTEFGVDLDAAGMDLDDALFLASMIEVPDDEVDDSWMALDYIEDYYEESEADRQAIVDKILGDFRHEGADEVTSERVSVLNRILKLGMKDRVKLAMKGDREARNILIRDPNRIVAQAVIQNPRITEQEVEKIASMRSVPEDILRKLASDRQWARSYTIVHNLARNPRTPVANIMNILTRLQQRDLMALAKSKNVSDAVRKQAQRLSQLRKGG